MKKPSILLDGMLGLGDNFHQRAVARYYLNQGYNVYLKTPWPQIYYDLPLTPIIIDSTLRAQSKNVKRVGFDKGQMLPNFNLSKKIWYTSKGVRENKSILGAMLKDSGVPIESNNFTFTPKKEWLDKAKDLVLINNREDKPVLFYRPLIERKEWVGCANRNPEILAYESLIDHIKDKFYVISIADIDNKEEWISGGNIKSDLTLHNGELDFETLCGLMYLSSMVFCSPGFALVMAQSLGVPNICIYGGRENSSAYQIGSTFTPSLGIDTIKPCMCFDHNHNCVKEIDIPKAAERIDKFVNEVI